MAAPDPMLDSRELAARTETGEMPARAPESPEAVQRLKALAGKRWVGRVIDVAVVLGVGAASAFLLTPGLSAQRIPYGDESLGSFSTSVLKAQRDYDILDEATTQQKRKEGRASVKPVYDYDLAIAEGTLGRVQAAFELMRKIEVDLRPRASPLATKAGERKRREVAELEKAFEVDLRGEYEKHREELFKGLQVSMDDEDFAALEQARFGPEVEAEVSRLVGRAMGQMVAEERDELFARGDRGVVVRSFKGEEALAERELVEVSGIRDQHELRSEATRWIGELPGETLFSLRKAVVHLVRRLIRPNLRFNAAATAERQRLAEEKVKPVVIQLKKGERIIGDGERVEQRHLVIFRAMKAQMGAMDLLQVRLGGALLAALLVASCFGFVRGGFRRQPSRRRDAVLVTSGLLAMLLLTNLAMGAADALRDRAGGLPSGALYFAIPFAAGAMLVRFVLDAPAALMFTVVFSALAGVLAGDSLHIAAYVLLGSLVAAHRVAKARDRAALFRVGLATGAVNAMAVACFALFGGKLFSVATLVSAASGFIGGALLAPILVIGLTPLVEALFDCTTDIKLLELANLNHPVLKDLIVQAPGTYHHSIIIGTLVEAAAEAIGANPLLARVCAYYHDIGKGKNPLYFGENQKGDNPHDRLAPAMSAVIIKRHVTDGMEMAKLYRLPRAVASAIPEHHGARLVGYFYHKALKEQEGKGLPVVDETVYRYAGPKPQSRETALVMIADAVEASSRALAEPSEQNLTALVQKIVGTIFADGQLDECEITLKDLRLISESFVHTLQGIYHSRPAYPVQPLGRPQLAEVLLPTKRVGP